MEYEKDFPDLYKKDPRPFCKVKRAEGEAGNCPVCKLNHTITFELFLKILKEYCLSKQRLDDAIEKVKKDVNKKEPSALNQGIVHGLFLLKQELNL